MAPVIRALQAEPWAQPIVVSTGQHRDLVRQILGLFDIQAHHDLDVMEPNQTLAGLSSRIFTKLDALLAEEHFDLLLTQGDTTSAMVASLGAFYRQIPVAHVEAGLRTHDMGRPFPEELNRRVISNVSRLHFAPTPAARANLLREHVRPEHIHVTGNTVIDALLDVADRNGPVCYPTAPDRRLILVTAHRRENFGAPILEICAAVRELHDRHPDVEFVYPVHPNPNIQTPVHAELGQLPRVHLIAPADYEVLVGLMKASYLILTDSGGIQEEAPALGKPVLVLREETERPEAIIAGVAQLVGTKRELIVRRVEKLLSDEFAYRRMARGGSPYGDGKAAQRIVAACRDLLHPSSTTVTEDFASMAFAG